MKNKYVGCLINKYVNKKSMNTKAQMNMKTKRVRKKQVSRSIN